MMHYFFGQHFPYPMMGFGGGFVLWVIVALVICLVVYLIVRGTQHHASSHAETIKDDQSVALKILNERYAKGEITDEEYKTKKMNLL